MSSNFAAVVEQALEAHGQLLVALARRTQMLAELADADGRRLQALETLIQALASQAGHHAPDPAATIAALRTRALARLGAQDRAPRQEALEAELARLEATLRGEGLAKAA